MSQSFLQVRIVLINVLETYFSNEKHWNIVPFFPDIKSLIFHECVNESFGRLLEKENICRMLFQGLLYFFYFLWLVQVGPAEVLFGQSDIIFGGEFARLNFFQIINFVDIFDQSVITYQVKQFHIFYLLWCGLWLHFLLGSGLLVALIPFFFEFLLTDEFVIFDTDIGAVNGSVPFDLDFLIDFTHIPLEGFFIEALNVGGD